MNQADISKLVSQLRIKVNPRLRRMKNKDGPEGRLLKLRKTVTGLVKHERLELNFNRGDEARMYAERLISDAIRYGDCNREMMEMADFWLLEKQLVHKLFKVLVPRFENIKTSYTRMYKAPRTYPGIYFARTVLELRGNPYPPLLPDTSSNRNLIHNVLLDEAKREFRAQKYSELAASLTFPSTEKTEAVPEIESRQSEETESEQPSDSKPLESTEPTKTQTVERDSKI